MYTVTCDYFATGAGMTHMVLFTRGYGPNEPAENAMASFKRIFGDYYAIGAEIKEGLDFDFPGAKFLISDKMRTNIIEWEKEAGGLEYHASFHVNFS
jgi:hypothetical protein